MLFEYAAIGTSALSADSLIANTHGSSSSGSTGGISNIDNAALSEALRGDVIKYMKDNLLKRIEDYELTGSAEVILTFSGDSLVNVYSEKYSDRMSYEEFKATAQAKR